jgi:hypothetical protein
MGVRTEARTVAGAGTTAAGGIAAGVGAGVGVGVVAGSGAAGATTVIGVGIDSTATIGALRAETPPKATTVAMEMTRRPWVSRKMLLSTRTRRQSAMAMGRRRPARRGSTPIDREARG